MPSTLYLDPASWDLALDSSGSIARADEPYALAQDAASAIRTFAGEVFYDTTIGIPYWTQILGKRPPLALMKARFVAAALTVPNVVSAQAFIASITERAVTGQVQVKDASGTLMVAGF